MNEYEADTIIGSVEAKIRLGLIDMPIKKFISFSGGVESTTMCILFGKGAKAIWCDTGAEHKKMYERIDLVEQKLIELHKGDFELIRIKANVKVKGEFVNNLYDAILKWRFMPSPFKRYCTGKFKIEPIDEFLSKQGNCELMIGLNADELVREGNWGLKTNVKYSYPLQEKDMSRADCEDILNIYGLHPNLPVFMLRGGCRICFYKSEKEYKALWYLDREEFNELVEFEDAYQGERKKTYTIMSNGKSLRQLAKECEMEMFQQDIIDIYNEYKKDAKSCGAFCRR
jgi:3'-phosphoadenosine 5'-phosphosulfate sulfotransferase (PAPS reductase)/FAD synthetase